MSRQKAQPLICEARIFTSSISDFFQSLSMDLASSAMSAFMMLRRSLVKIVRFMIMLLLLETGGVSEAPAACRLLREEAMKAMMSARPDEMKVSLKAKV